MTEPAALSGTFSDFKIVKGRKVAQLVVEIPIEEADRALKILGGVPRSDIERWVAVARLDTDKIGPQAGLRSGSPEPGAVTAGGPAPLKKRPFHTLPRSQQAALACRDEEGFALWLQRTYAGLWSVAVPNDSPHTPSHEIAAVVVRQLCGTATRAALIDKTEAAERWDALYSKYLMATGRMAEPRACAPGLRTERAKPEDAPPGEGHPRQGGDDV